MNCCSLLGFSQAFGATSEPFGTCSDLSIFSPVVHGDRLNSRLAVHAVGKCRARGTPSVLGGTPRQPTWLLFDCACIPTIALFRYPIAVG